MSQPLLTPKQERFCQEYIIDLNATQAATRAGYSVKTANQQAARMLTNVNIQARIAQLQEQRQERTQLTQDEVIDELGLIARANIEDFLTIENEQVKLQDFSKIDRKKLGVIQSIKKGRDGSITLSLHSKMSALGELAQIMGLKTDLNLAIASFAKYGIDVKRTEDGKWFIPD
ncbi:terminase small subunit [Chamaesiphon minutus]|uniref:Phage terminase, small subunit n=1 Tax=Chamaesiphon minutus (strain ATCC 27169 / PCC 6605) TaxID=1173020 RepID=K9UK56_CHAP6|nr:terminase small subunit [Chamaesiphon minutus]AFY95482.1 phage terminase, small subunit [Chamaesiphon minutus PCC 6605]